MQVSNLGSIIGLRNNIVISIYEYFGNMRLYVGGSYYANNRFIPIDKFMLKPDDQVSEFHWKANNLEIVLIKK